MRNAIPDLPDDPQNADDANEVEALLRGLPLRGPGLHLDRRIDRLTRRARWMERAKLAGVGIAALFVGAIGLAPLLQSPPVRTAANEPRVTPPNQRVVKTAARDAAAIARPMLVQHMSARVKDDGVVGLIGNTPVQRYRRHSVQQLWLVDPQTGVKTCVTIPRDEVVLRKVQPF